MDKQEQRTAIAKACGWVVSYDPPHYQGLHPKLHEADHSPVSLPDYCNDLNAMHEAEKVLDFNQLYKYFLHIQQNTGSTAYHGSLNTLILRATAAQRAEAFLKTLNLWTDAR